MQRSAGILISFIVICFGVGISALGQIRVANSGTAPPTFSSLPSTNGGVVTLTATDTFVYQPVAACLGSDLFTNTISDARGGFANAAALVTVASGQSLNQVSLTVSNGQPVVTYAGTSNLIYTIQRTASLSPPAWTNVGTVSADGMGRIVFLDTNAPFANAFYRARHPSSAVLPLQQLSVATDTGEKPQSKVWTHDGKWWAVLPTTTAASSAGSWLWRLQGTAWVGVLKLSANTGTKADVKCIGNVAHILLHATNSLLVSVEYTGGAYQPWSLRSTASAISLPDSETATIDVDSTGRMWLASESGTSVVVYYSDSPYSVWHGPLILTTDISTDDISVVTALPNNTIAVLWSDQHSQRFGFKVHADGADPTVWSADEVPASQSALNVGLGMADDHLNVAVASDGTLYAAVKTSYDTAGYPKIALLVRRPGSRWDDLHPVDEAGTRPIVLLNEAEGIVTLVYTSVEGNHDIVYKQTPISTIAFGSRTTLIAGANNNATSTKQNITGEVVILAGDGFYVRGVLWTNALPPGAKLSISD